MCKIKHCLSKTNQQTSHALLIHIGDYSAQSVVITQKNLLPPSKCQLCKPNGVSDCLHPGRIFSQKTHIQFVDKKPKSILKKKATFWKILVHMCARHWTLTEKKRCQSKTKWYTDGLWNEKKKTLTGLRTQNQLKRRGGNLVWEEDDVNRWERKGMLPNLSAADVACWAELSFRGILGRWGTVDPRRAEKCGREEWQETERRDLFREPLCVMTEWQDTEVCVCVRWLYIQEI